MQLETEINRVIDLRLSELREEVADAYDDDLDDDEPFGPSGKLFERVTVPVLVVAFTALCTTIASGLIWATVAIWQNILA